MKSTLLFCGFVWVLFAGCGRLPDTTPPEREAIHNDKPPTADQLAEFTQHTGIVFPPEAVPLHWSEERGMDDSLFLKIAMPKEALTSILAKPPFVGKKLSSPEKLREGPIFHFESRKGWMPNRPKHYEYCDLWLPNARALECIFDYDDPQITVLYLLWAET